LFDGVDFGEPKEYPEERVAWLKVPKGTTVEEVEKTLKKYPNACIYKILSSNPILTSSQKQSMENGLNTLTIADYAEKQKVIDTKTGKAALFNGKEQYRVTFFSKNLKEDEDNRLGGTQIATPQTTHTSEEVAAEKAAKEDMQEA
jgi:hypothetical protein